MSVEMVTGEEASALQEADSGVLRLRAADPFSAEVSVLWMAVQSLAFALVCEAHENLLLAEGTLRNLTRHCLEHLHMLGPGSEVITAPTQTHSVRVTSHHAQGGLEKISLILRTLYILRQPVDWLRVQTSPQNWLLWLAFW